MWYHSFCQSWTIRIGADLMQEMNGGHEQKWVAQGSEQKVKR